MSDDNAWLDDDAPFSGLTKRQLADATGFSLKQIDARVRDGAPMTKGRFDLPAFVQWLEGQRLSDDPRLRERAAAAALKEQVYRKREGELVEVDKVIKAITDFRTALQTEFMTIPQRCALPPDTAEAVRCEIIRSINKFSEGATGAITNSASTRARVGWHSN